MQGSFVIIAVELISGIGYSCRDTSNSASQVSNSAGVTDDADCCIIRELVLP